MTELLIVVSVLVILATIAVPNYLTSKAVANETAVIASMKRIAQAQFAFREGRFIDRDRDTMGEFGFIGELSGIVAMRGSGEFLQPPTLNPAFGFVDADGFADRHGYNFRVYLPDSAGAGVPEVAAQIGNVDPEQSSIYFTCLAWPRVYGRSGQRTFFLNQRGDVLATVDTGYSGKNGAPVANAALVGVPPGVITTNSIASPTDVAVDGNRWQPVQ
jgi:type II secretory pathway pseudopilin PulG